MGKTTPSDQEWEARLTQEGMPAHLGYERERHGHDDQRVFSLDARPDLADQDPWLAVTDPDPFDQPATDTRPARTLPPQMAALAEKRLRDEPLTAAERKAVKRHRDRELGIER